MQRSAERAEPAGVHSAGGGCVVLGAGWVLAEGGRHRGPGAQNKTRLGGWPGVGRLARRCSAVSTCTWRLHGGEAGQARPPAARRFGDDVYGWRSRVSAAAATAMALFIRRRACLAALPATPPAPASPGPQSDAATAHGQARQRSTRLPTAACRLAAQPCNHNGRCNTTPPPLPVPVPVPVPAPARRRRSSSPSPSPRSPSPLPWQTALGPRANLICARLQSGRHQAPLG